MKPLADLKILVPESRELDLFATMLESEGATALRCPLVRILDLEQTAEAQAWIGRLIAGAFQDVIWLTGEGLRRLLALAAQSDRQTEFVAALANLRSITRGPKPARALRELGLVAGLTAGSPTSRGILDALSAEDLVGRSIGVQTYPGDGALPLLEALQAQGAKVTPVTPYRYATEAETGQVEQTIRALAAGHIGMIAFTASPQIEWLFQMARDAGLEKVLADGLALTPVAAIGPVVEETLNRHGVRCAVRPRSNFHLKPLVRAIMAWRAA